MAKTNVPIRRIRSNNPSLVDTKHLRAPEPDASTDPTDFEVEQGDVFEPVEGSSVKEYLSPPSTQDSGRPRAREATYDRTSHELTVVFRNGGTYVYLDVALRDWRALQRNRSFGQTLDRLIIGTYPWRKVSF